MHWTIVIAGNGDAAVAAERAASMVRRLETEGQHIAYGACTTGHRRQVVFLTPPPHQQLTLPLSEA